MNVKAASKKVKKLEEELKWEMKEKESASGSLNELQVIRKT